MYKRILVPLDGSSHAEAILPQVEQLALCCEATVILMKVIEPIPVVMDMHASVVPLRADEMREREQASRDYLNDCVERLHEKRILTRTHLMEGPVIEAILEVAGSENVDLIAMTTHGREGLERMVFGSVAEGVLHHSDKPLLLIRTR